MGILVGAVGVQLCYVLDFVVDLAILSRDTVFAQCLGLTFDLVACSSDPKSINLVQAISLSWKL